MNKTLKVEFQEQSKGVVANVKVEISGNPSQFTAQEVLDEAVSIFNKASVTSYQHTKTKGK